MEFLLLDDVGESIQKKENLIFYPDFTNSWLRNWIVTSVGVDTRKMCVLLNTIRDQGIEYINLKAYVYTIKGKDLSLVNLSTGERVFFCAELARQTKTHIYLYKGLSQLTPRSQCKFFSEFGDCMYIHILCEHVGVAVLYKKRGGLV